MNISNGNKWFYFRTAPFSSYPQPTYPIGFLAGQIWISTIRGSRKRRRRRSPSYSQPNNVRGEGRMAYCLNRKMGLSMAETARRLGLGTSGIGWQYRGDIREMETSDSKYNGQPPPHSYLYFFRGPTISKVSALAERATFSSTAARSFEETFSGEPNLLIRFDVLAT